MAIWKIVEDIFYQEMIDSVGGIFYQEVIGGWDVTEEFKCFCIEDDNGMQIAIIPQYLSDFEEAYAHAHIVAAAPELLQELERLAGLIDDIVCKDYKPDHSTTNSAWDVIKRAKWIKLW